MLVNAIDRDRKKMYEEGLKEGKQEGLKEGEMKGERETTDYPGVACQRHGSSGHCRDHRVIGGGNPENYISVVDGLYAFICTSITMKRSSDIEHCFGDLRKTQLPINIRISYTSSSST